MVGGQETINESQGGNSITTGSQHDVIVLSGSGNKVNASGGTNRITDNGPNDKVVIPAAGVGRDNIYGTVLSNGDTLDLRAALAATSWDGKASDLGTYLTGVIGGNGDFQLRLRDATSGTRSIIADLHNYGQSTTLSEVLAHCLT
jgi:hypothetical protein